MTLNLKIKINNDNLCIKHNGKNISPIVSWNSISNVKSYALILEDPDAPMGNFIHWYIPYISNKITFIDNLLNTDNIIGNITNNINNTQNINLIQGYNSTNKLGYFGLCNPETNKYHRYIFTLYGLDNIIPNIKDNLNIRSSKEFNELLNSYNIKVLNYEINTCKYKRNSNIMIT